MSAPAPPVCGIPGHPAAAHGSHPGCGTHGPMHFHDRMWICHGFDGEGCTGPRIPDAFCRPDEHERWQDWKP